MWLTVSGLMVMGLVSGLSLVNHSDSESFLVAHKSLISSVFLTRTSWHKTTHVNGYLRAWPGWAVSVCVLPLTGSQRVGHD